MAKIKKSDYMRERTDYWTGAVEKVAAKVADDVRACEAAGMEWEPEVSTLRGKLRLQWRFLDYCENGGGAWRCSRCAAGAC